MSIFLNCKLFDMKIRIPRKQKKKYTKIYINGMPICKLNTIRDTVKYGKYTFWVGIAEVPKEGHIQLNT